ncbi:hypothetical protein BGZ99_001704, partial [Dissophora globulifera]
MVTMMIGTRKRRSDKTTDDREITEQILGASEESLGASKEATTAEGSPRPAKRVLIDDTDSEDAIILTGKLTDFVYGNRPVMVERLAIEYVVKMRMDPRVNRDEFVAYIRSEYPSALINTIERTWIKLKHFFDGNHKAQYMVIETLADIEKMIDAFLAVANVEDEEEEEQKDPPTHDSNHVQSSTSCNTRSTSTRSARKSSSSGSSNSSSVLKAVGLAKMRDEFSQHYHAFKGEPWILASGTVVDQVIAEHIKMLSYESTLHSFIIEDVEAVVDLFPEESDRVEVQMELGQQLERRMASLSPEELDHLALYDKSPSEMDDFLASGWASKLVSTESALPNKEFRRLVHHCVQQLYFVYHKDNFLLPREQSESWFMHKLWGIINVIFDNKIELDHQPGETLSQASALRKNKGRNFDDRQLLGRKADGLIVASDTRLEICIIEAAKKDAGAT